MNFWQAIPWHLLSTVYRGAMKRERALADLRAWTCAASAHLAAANFWGWQLCGSRRLVPARCETRLLHHDVPTLCWHTHWEAVGMTITNSGSLLALNGRCCLILSGLFVWHGTLCLAGQVARCQTESGT
jgi:hypothetical protein